MLKDFGKLCLRKVPYRFQRGQLPSAESAKNENAMIFGKYPLDQNIAAKDGTDGHASSDQWHFLTWFAAVYSGSFWSRWA